MHIVCGTSELQPNYAEQCIQPATTEKQEFLETDYGCLILYLNQSLVRVLIRI